jgi:hypothetical protein
MAAPRGWPYPGGMTSLAVSSASAPSPSSSSSRGSAPTAGSAVRIQAFTAAVILAAFGAFSLWVVYGYGYTGFLTLAGREPWALQMLLDLVIALSFAIGWMRADARRRGIAAWPYFLVTLVLGSIGVLAYVVRRGLGNAR